MLGKEHPSTLTIMHNLAVLYKAQARYQEAEELYKEVLEKQEDILGKEHPSTLNTIHNLAGLYKDQGNYEEAERIYKEVLEKQRRHTRKRASIHLNYYA